MGNSNLTKDQEAFKQLLDKFHYLLPYWNFEKCECDYTLLRKNLGQMSHGESTIARFMAGVWSGENILEFDYFDAVQTLDDDHMIFITTWGSDPFYP